MGPGMEALGYLLFQEDGRSDTAVDGRSLRDRLQRILQDLDNHLPFDGDVWASLFVACYNGVKHVNREWPTELDILKSIRGAILVA